MDSQAVLSHLFDSVGTGHFLYVAGVSRSWRTHYTPKAGAKHGKNLTSWRDAVATISALEYAFANDLKFTPESHPEENVFGPGVYEWARHHGFPLYVWVAWEVEAACGEVGGFVKGVFSEPKTAKQAAVESCEIDAEDYDWGSRYGGFELDLSGDEGSMTFSVKAFPVKGLAYADEVSPLPLYVTTTTYSGCENDYGIDGVFSTKKLANRSIKKEADEYGVKTQKENGFLSLTLDHEMGTEESIVEWEGYLDGDGGAPGRFFKNEA